jgi:hypothetical protein
LIIATKERNKTSRARSISTWMYVFINKESEIDHEAFLASWLSIFVFPHKCLWVKSSLFPIVVQLARGNTIAYGSPVLERIYKDLRVLKEAYI